MNRIVRNLLASFIMVGMVTSLCAESAQAQPSRNWKTEFQKIKDDVACFFGMKKYNDKKFASARKKVMAFIAVFGLFLLGLGIVLYMRGGKKVPKPIVITWDDNEFNARKDIIDRALNAELKGGHFMQLIPGALNTKKVELVAGIEQNIEGMPDGFRRALLNYVKEWGGYGYTAPTPASQPQPQYQGTIYNLYEQQ